VITDLIQEELPEIPKSVWTDGKTLLVDKLLRAFQTFWKNDSDSFPKQIKDFAAIRLDEATHVFILMAFLQRAINGGADIFRESSEGRGAVDIRLTYNNHSYLIEVKLATKINLTKAYDQVIRYLDSRGEKEGWLVIFDRDDPKSWDEKIYERVQEINGYTIRVFGC
ncbi:MAG: hypothetical protein LBT38_11590, partial [Deltaproteobacteria bacterium]|nr:hypothetical protein [Deltaproteobacteria bacterium]